MCYDDRTQNMRNLYCFKDLYIGIIVLVVKRRGFFGHVFRFSFNGQHRKQIEQSADTPFSCACAPIFVFTF